MARPGTSRRRHGIEVLVLSTARVLAVRAAMFGIFVALAGAGCFRPKIVSGGFKCDLTKGATPCPDNFVCIGGLCVTPTTDAGTDGAKGGSGGAGGHAGAGGGGKAGGGGEKMDAHPDVQPDVPCLPAVANTNCPEGNSAGICDPVCNRGCGHCYEKCSIAATDSGLACNAPVMPTVQLLADQCGFSSPGTSAQTDNCGPGQVCITAECANRCYQFCRTSADCTNATCSRDAGGGFLACDVPYVNCDPVRGVAANESQCGSSVKGCYLSATGSKTLCDCPFGQPKGTGTSCSHSRDCSPGLVCYNATGLGSECYPICRLQTDGGAAPQAGESPCTGSVTCQALPGQTVYGYCNET
jgi:hypothetical protein